MLARIFLLLLLLPVGASAAPPPFDVLDYSADLRLDLAEQSVRGEVAVTFESTADGLSAVELDAPGLTIESVSERGAPVSHEVREGKLRAVLERPAARGERRTLTVRYTGKPERGCASVRIRSSRRFIPATGSSPGRTRPTRRR